MSKMKKFWLPWAFFAGVVALIIGMHYAIYTLFDSGDFAALIIWYPGLALWILGAIPVFSYQYGKHIREEKRKELLVCYHAIVQSLFALLTGSPFVRFVSFGLFFAWVAFWTGLPLILQHFSQRKQAEQRENNT